MADEVVLQKQLSYEMAPARLQGLAGRRSPGGKWLVQSLQLPPSLSAPSDVLPTAGRDPAAERRALAERHTDPTATAGVKKLA